jgi:hypothetical protein
LSAVEKVQAALEGYRTPPEFVPRANLDEALQPDQPGEWLLQ